MGISIGDLSRSRKEVVYETSMGNVKIVYAPNALTPNDEAALFEARSEGPKEAYQALLGQICKLVIDWELYGELLNSETGDVIVEEGNKIPVVPDIIQHMPNSVLGAIYQLILEDNAPKATKEQKNRPASSSPNASGKVFASSFD